MLVAWRAVTIPCHDRGCLLSVCERSPWGAEVLGVPPACKRPWPALCLICSTAQEVDSAVFRSVCEFAKSSPVGRADPDAYAEVKKVMSN